MRCLKITILILGTMIGAGFASGKEITIFFTIFGYYSFLCLPLVFFGFYFYIYKLLRLGAENKIENTNQLNYLIFKKNNKIIKIFTFISFVIISSTMISGFKESLEISSTFSLILFIFIVIIFLCILINKNLKYLNIICMVTIPITIIIICIICFTNFDGLHNTLLSNIVLLPYNTITYITRNVFLCYFVISSSSFGLTQKQCKKISFWSSIILCAVMAVMIFAGICNPETISDSIPMLSLAQSQDALYIIYAILIEFAIITTLISTTITVKSFFNFKSKILNSFLAVILCVMCSFIKFDFLIKYFYPIIGIFGAYLILFLMFPNLSFQNSNKEIHDTSKDTKY